MKNWVFCFLMLFGVLAVQGAPTNDGMYATMQTTMGDVCFELYYTNVPRTVANFVSLAEGTRPWIDPRDTFVSNDPYYNGIIFHRVITNFMIQCGSPQGTGTDGPGYTFEDEFNPILRHDHPGVVSMANSGADSNGGQFFITVTDTSWLDDVHTVFGNVIEGMQVVSNIAAVAVNTNNRPLVDVAITNVFITRNGTNALNFAVTNQLLPEVEALPMTIAFDSEIKLFSGTATSSYQYVYSSTNLSEWLTKASDYWPVPDGEWNRIVSGEEKGFFHANRVAYPTDKNRTGSPILHQLVMTIGSDVLTIAPDGINSGRVRVNLATNAALTYWSWDATPYRVQFIVDSDYYFPFGFDLYYTSPTNGRCVGYYYNAGWYYIGSDGEGTFTDVDLNP
ncbi:MAG: peptidylprolyl isomerase [Kiritimatiellales bacterium]